KFGVAGNLPHKRLPCPGILIASQTDPWMKAEHAAQWARRWNCKYIDGGALGHINAESRLGDWVYGQAQLQTLFDLAQSDKRHRQAA
ncbi:RBBP9/YdeN family alpha/beta hydrolase, partial [Vibrio parahaemolyticus]|uniref:RBBP9/YdeN family alpha/beta hydrolase n=1 Tax=Vibrio parahaemolyticus TaxID=670 RepID=UPI0021127C43